MLETAGIAPRQWFSPGHWISWAEVAPLVASRSWPSTGRSREPLRGPSRGRWVCEVLLDQGTRFPLCCLGGLCGSERSLGRGFGLCSSGSDPAVCSSPPAHSTLMTSPQTEEFFDLIASSQSRRLDDQRANVGNLPGLRITQNNLGHLRVEGDAQEPGDEFFNMLMKCQVRARGWGSSTTPAPAPSPWQGWPCPALR